jgi:alanine-glyoxylate transaminase / serine-glyoxylate transaminase / serine-pyruvate transaminase
MSDSKMPFSPINPPARFLFGPGPTQVDPRVYEAMTNPIVGHLDSYFFQVLTDVRGMLRAVFGTTNEFTLAISGTGSAGMETAIGNFVEPGMKVGIFANGFFCDRITEMCKRHEANIARFEKPWGDIFGDDEAAEFIRREKPHVVIYVQAETSTGAFQQGNAICAAAHEVGAIVITDCVTSLGAMPVKIDETGIDVAYSCSQKGLSCPPGLAPFTVSPRAMERLKARKSPIREWYLDLRLLEEYYDGPHKYHHTAPISMFYALHQALAVISEEGLEQRWKRHHDSHRTFVNRIEALGLQMHVAEGHRIWNLNTPRIPDGINDAAVRKTLLEQDGIEILGGFGQLAGKVFRIGVMGPLATSRNLDFFFERFSKALTAAGYSIPATAIR